MPRTAAVNARGLALGRYLRRLRLQAGLSQEALAERAGIGVATVAALEEGRRRRPYPNTVAVLSKALDLEPGDHRTLLELAHAQQQADAPAEPRTPSARRATLPVPPTSLIGRAAEVVTAARRLDPVHSQVRLLSLLGPGGVGKTRLALATAAALIDSFADGVVFVDLSSVHDQRMVPVTIARALDIREPDGRSARELLLEHLRDRRMLLVLDNFEHLLDAGPFVADLLTDCAALRVLVTSRSALRLRAEQRHEVPPLPTPDDPNASPAVQLFVDRAQAVAAQFVLAPDNAQTINAICRRVDGIPLAIELAAARISILTPQQLLARLDRRLAELVGGALDLPDRQRTLRNTLEWSAELLSAAQRRLLYRLAVFANDWTLEAVEAVCAEPESSTDALLDGLRTLVESSLVQRSVGSDGVPRLSMLETVREYALDGLVESGELQAVQRRHVEWYLSVVQPLRPSPPDPASVRKLAAHAANLRAAIGYAIEDNATEHGLWLAVALAMLCYVRGAYGEGRGWLNALLEAPGAQAPTLARAHALAAAGLLAYWQGDYAVASDVLLEAQGLNRQHGDALLDAVIVYFLANNARRRGELAHATNLYRDCLAQFEKVGHQTWLASALTHLALIAADMGETQRATELAQRSLALFESNDSTWGVSLALRALGRIATERGDHVEARRFHEASLALVDQLGDTHNRTLSLVALANNVLMSGDPLAAAEAYAESLSLADASGDQLSMARSLAGLARCSPRELWETAVRVAGAADRLRTRLKAVSPTAEQHDLRTWLEAAREALGEDRFGMAWSSGQTLERAQAVADGLRLAPARS